MEVRNRFKGLDQIDRVPDELWTKVNRVLPRERTGRRNHPLPTTQEKTLHMGNTRWSIPKSD